jgi:hypothetical protein
LSDDDFAYFEKHGKVSDICQRIVLDHRNKGELTPKVFREMRQLLEAIQSVDATAKEILGRLPVEVKQ